jgi:hypothetical protein
MLVTFLEYLSHSIPRVPTPPILCSVIIIIMLMKYIHQRLLKPQIPLGSCFCCCTKSVSSS